MLSYQALGLSLPLPRPGSHSPKPAAGCAAPHSRVSRHSRIQPLAGEGSQGGLLQQKSGDEMLPAEGQEAGCGPEGLPSPRGQRQPGSKGKLCLAEDL